MKERPIIILSTFGLNGQQIRPCSVCSDFLLIWLEKPADKTTQWYAVISFIILSSALTPGRLKRTYRNVDWQLPLPGAPSPVKHVRSAANEPAVVCQCCPSCAYCSNVGIRHALKGLTPLHVWPLAWYALAVNHVQFVIVGLHMRLHWRRLCFVPKIYFSMHSMSYWHFKIFTL